MLKPVIMTDHLHPPVEFANDHIQTIVASCRSKTNQPQPYFWKHLFMAGKPVSIERCDNNTQAVQRYWHGWIDWTSIDLAKCGPK